MKLTPEQIKENEKKYWTRSAPADLYYSRDPTNPLVMHSTDRYVTNSCNISYSKTLRYTVFDWIQKDLRYTDFGQKPCRYGFLKKIPLVHKYLTRF